MATAINVGKAALAMRNVILITTVVGRAIQGPGYVGGLNALAPVAAFPDVSAITETRFPA
jgi:hypothetical protein